MFWEYERGMLELYPNGRLGSTAASGWKSTLHLLQLDFGTLFGMPHLM